MEFVNKVGDLFDAPERLLDELKCDNIFHGRKHAIYYAHCISADCALGAGIAKQFEHHFCLRRDLKKLDVKVHKTYLIGTVFNLVTKKNYWDKPSYPDVGKALRDLRDQCVKLRVKNLVIPHIGCGLDGLSWILMEDIVKEIFRDLDIKIFAYEFPETKV